MITALALILAAAATPSSPACAKLTHDFEQNERQMAASHGIYQKLYDIDLAFWTARQPSERALRMAEAVAGSRRTQAERDKLNTDLEEARQAIVTSDAKYVARGDRITTLLIANRCTPPDHVTSWTTYSE